MRFGARAETDRARENEPVSVGGIATTIVPLSAAANHVLDPALTPSTLKMPRTDVTIGAARMFTEPLRNRTRWWIAVRLQP